MDIVRAWREVPAPLKGAALAIGNFDGVHLGQGKQPFLEDDPLLADAEGSDSWPPIFYYEQQRILAHAAVNSHWDWVVTLPEDVLGYARGNFMNEATAIGLYCAVSKALPGSELPFLGSKANYFAFNCWTSANLHAKFCLWAAEAPGATVPEIRPVLGSMLSPAGKPQAAKPTAAPGVTSLALSDSETPWPSVLLWFPGLVMAGFVPAITQLSQSRLVD